MWSDKLPWLEMLISKDYPKASSWKKPSPLKVRIWLHHSSPSARDGFGMQEGSKRGSSAPARSPAEGLVSLGPGGALPEGTEGVWLGTASHVSHQPAARLSRSGGHATALLLEPVPALRRGQLRGQQRQP